MHKKKIRFLLLLTACFLLAHITQAQPPCTLDVQINPPSPVLNCQNPTVQLNVTINPPGGNLSWSWSGPVSDSTILNPTVSQPGTYIIFVFDSLNACWGTSSVVVTSDPALPSVNISASNISCDIQNDPIELSAAVTGGSGNYSYSWTGGQTTPQIEVTDPGTYCVTVIDLIQTCTLTQCFTLTLPLPLEASINYYNGFFCGDSSVMCLNISGGTPPYSYLWNNQSTTPCVFDLFPGDYIVTATDGLGCTVVATQVVEDDPNECARITGSVLADWNTNCTVESSDEGISGIKIKIENLAGDEFFTYTNADGEYNIELFPGTYIIGIIPPNNLWDPCQNGISLTLQANQTTSQDFLLKPLAVCPAMTVDIANSWLRRCFEGHYSVYYCNRGTAAATDAYIDIQLDPFLTLTDAQLPYTGLGNNQYRFNLGTVPFNTCSHFWIKVNTSCDATLGQTHCTEAIIHPTGDCLPPDPLWSGASLQIEANCSTDSLDFLIRNVGTGTTLEPLEYVIIEDAVMLMQAPPPAIFLAPGGAHHVKVRCTTGAQFSTGFVNQFPADDNDPWVDIDCRENVGSYDPNDKQGFPVGYQSERYIDPGTDIEYLIRFQNTGTDTAFTVVIRDELSPWLDPGSVVPGAASHPYQFEFYNDRNIKFTFENINLPDSSKSQELSQGFVKFRISQKPGVPLQTDILNHAGIYFDFNEPVITNTTRHRVGKDFITVSAWQPFLDGLTLRVMPNPVSTSALLQIDGLKANASWTAELSDATGKPVRSAQLNGSQWRFERELLPAGIYFLRIVSGDRVLGTGKIMLK
ncbi:MAG: T9SS type A sorting domain-containing protein [Thermoanaerobaculia bacterium]|nr:T9SS type A sorting domain-containing protein [Thermoanaerobaculia bacterium]